MVTALAQAQVPDQDLIPPRRRVSMHPLIGFVLRRVGGGLLTLLFASVVIFLATQALPGNVAQIVLGRNASPEAVTQAEARLGLDRPLVVRYGEWLAGMASGDLGESAVAVAQGAPSAPISRDIGEPLRNSAILAGIVIVLMIPLSVVLGAVAALRVGRPIDHLTSMVSLVIGAFPEFVFGTILVFVLFSQLHLLPPVALIAPGESPLAHLDVMVLPVLTALGVVLASGVRQIRGGMIDTLEQDYVSIARINGLPERRVQARYALRNALPAGVQITAQNVQYLLGGIIVVESVFTYSGIGTYLVNAVNVRDVNKVEAVAMILATIYIGINILADLIVVMLVPKLRTAL